MTTRIAAICNLGCSKNLVDGENIGGWFAARGFSLTQDYSTAEVILVNTCAFIQEAKQEAIDTVLQMAEYKKEGVCTKLIVCGCFSQRYRTETAHQFPEVDHWVGVHSWESELSVLFPSPSAAPSAAAQNHRILSGPASFQYLKISEGCSHQCAFCVIPSIRGGFQSRPYTQIRDEALWLYDQGARECIVVSQDTSFYGRDIGSTLDRLLEQLLHDTSFPWIRLMYLHPAYVSDELLKLMASEPRICPYLDMPLQHIADPILRSMRRAPLSEGIRDLVNRIRTHIPRAAIRTSFIVGYPGETAAHFQELLAFVEESRFDRLGVFPFSPEEGTPAHTMKPRPSMETANRRCEELMNVQREISADICTGRVGTVVPVIIDGSADDPALGAEGRTPWDAPEVDGRVFIKNAPFHPGTIGRALITRVDDYDLFADDFL